MKQRSELRRDPEKLAAFQQRARESSARALEQGRLRNGQPIPRGSKAKPARTISPASPAQREKVADMPCIGCGREASAWLSIDPAHIAARGYHGGCDDPLCVIPLCRDAAGVGCHKRLDGAVFDEQPFNLLAKLVGRWVPELQHALGHYDGNLLGLVHRLTGERHVPERRAG